MKLADIKFYGTAAAHKLAKEALNALWGYVVNGDRLLPTALDEFQAQVRRDLLVPDDISPTPASSP
jgi:hypothetical protein